MALFADDGTGRNRQPMRYALVTPDGEIEFGDKTFHQIRALLVGDDAGETGMEFPAGLYPVAAYYYVPYASPDTRRMNKVANGMFWELSEPLPPDPDVDPAEVEPEGPEDRVVKLRGPVAFIDRQNWGLTGAQEAALRAAQETAVKRLRDRGWL